MSFLIRAGAGLWGRRGALVRGVLVVFFVWLAGRYWDPYHGFTRLLQIEAKSAANLLPVLRSAPIYFHRETAGGYDGQFYAQLAVSPGLRDPDLPASIDNLGYRARRILLSAVAWAIGWGEPVAAIRAYASLNVGLWFVLAALLWRLFPPGDWRATVAWAGLLFAAGTLQSVRFALTDLAALTLLAGALWQLERGRSRSGLGWLSLALLARETSVLGAVALLPGAGASRGEWKRACGRGILVILPLAVWLIYLQLTVGGAEAGQRNFSWPVTGLVDHWCEAVIGLEVESDLWLPASSVMVQLALTVQLLFLFLRPQWHNPWWRMGAAYGGLLLCLGPAVWEGYLSAAPRVLLPLALAFNVLAVRTRAGALWLILGNLTVLNGILALWVVPENPRELTKQWTWSHSYQLETDRQWFVTETRWSEHWRWCPQNGQLTLRTWPHRDKVGLQLRLKGFNERDLKIRQAGRVVWQGRLGAKLGWIQLPVLATDQGDLVLELHSDTPPQREGPESYARDLGFACYGFKPD